MPIEKRLHWNSIDIYVVVGNRYSIQVKHSSSIFECSNRTGHKQTHPRTNAISSIRTALGNCKQHVCVNAGNAYILLSLVFGSVPPPNEKTTLATCLRRIERAQQKIHLNWHQHFSLLWSLFVCVFSAFFVFMISLLCFYFCLSLASSWIFCA